MLKIFILTALVLHKQTEKREDMTSGTQQCHFLVLFMFAACFLSSHSVPVLTVSMSFAPAWSGPTGHASIQEQRERWEKKHNLTAVELLQTERRYCEQLELVTTVGLPATTPSVTTDLNRSSHRSEKDSHHYGDSHKP